MTPVILTNNSVINTAEITWEHIVVAIILGNPCILNKGYKEPAEQLSFKHIGAGSFGNGFDEDKKNFIKDISIIFYNL